MSTPQTHISKDCGCVPTNITVAGAPCCDCQPLMALSYEEEAILERLRAIKVEARPLARELKNIERRRFDGQTSDPVSIERELIRLTNELDDLRSSWKEWEKRLEDAIERKWILLGHREPRA